MFIIGLKMLLTGLVVYSVLSFNICMCEELTAMEGKEFMLTCSGNISKANKEIWWTSTKVLSKCYPDEETCINHYPTNFIATNSPGIRKYTSRLKINNVGPENRDQIFNCVDQSSSSSFMLRVYHLPDLPECKAEKLSRGRIKVTCHTSKVYPDILCDFSTVFKNTTLEREDEVIIGNADLSADVLYKTNPINIGNAMYNNASCSSVLCTKQAGLYRFKVKMYPNITNGLVPSLDGYTNFIAIQDQSCGSQMKESDNGNIDKEITVITNAMAEMLAGQEHPKDEQEQMVVDLGNKKLEGICENYKHIINNQQTVILILTCILVCDFIFRVTSRIIYFCRKQKKCLQDQV